MAQCYQNGCYLFYNMLSTCILYSVGTTSQGGDSAVSELRSVCLSYLLQQVNTLTHHTYKMADLYLYENTGSGSKQVVMETEEYFSIPPFSVRKGERLFGVLHIAFKVLVI